MEEARLLASALATNKNLVTLKYVSSRRACCATIVRLTVAWSLEAHGPSGARSLQSNEIGDAGAQAILEALASNRSSALTTLAYAWRVSGGYVQPKLEHTLTSKGFRLGAVGRCTGSLTTS